LARQAHGAYNREGINGILEYLDPAVEWRNPIESPNSGVFVGPDGVPEWQRMVDDAFEEMQFEPERIEELPDGRILAVLRVRMRLNQTVRDARPAVHVRKAPSIQ
jgi:ketosteroid isomerase-like protein